MDQKLIKAVIIRIQKAEKFVLKELPEICQQLVTEETIDCYFNIVTYGVLSILLLVAGLVSVYLFHVTPFDSDRYNTFKTIHMVTFIVAPLSFLFVIPTSLDVINNIQQLIYLKTCTKLFLIRQLKKLVKN